MDLTHHLLDERPRFLGRVLGLTLAASLVSACGGTADGDGTTGPGAAPGTSTAAVTSDDTSQEGTTSESATASASETTPATSTTNDDAAGEAAEDVVIVIADFDYEVPDSVPPGAEITVRNDDVVGHTVTSEDDGATFDVVVPAGETVTLTAPEEAGEFPFFCRPHPNMQSTLIVEEG